MAGAAPRGRQDRGLRPPGPRRPAGRWVSVVALSAWLVGWAWGEWQAVQRLFFSDGAGGEAWFLGLWLLLWTAGGLFALRALLRLLAGHELPPTPPEEPPGFDGG